MSRESEQNPTQFKPGQSGNPAGKPKGTRNATTLALEALLDGQASALTQKAINLALAGDMAALRLCLDRILPPRKDSPVAFELPEIKTLNDAVPAMGALVKAVGQGDHGGGRRADKNGAGVRQNHRDRGA